MNVELNAAEALLDKGVSVPFQIRIPLTRWVWHPRFTMRRPRLGGQIRIARLRLKMGVTAEQMRALTAEEQDVFMSMHGKGLSKIIALTICRGYVSGMVLMPIVAWFIRHFVDVKWILGSHKVYKNLLGTKSFSAIISLAETMNPMSPHLSH